MGKNASITHEYETKWGNINSALTTAYDDHGNKTSLRVFTDMIPINFTEEKICGFHKWSNATKDRSKRLVD